MLRPVATRAGWCWGRRRRASAGTGGRGTSGRTWGRSVGLVGENVATSRKNGCCGSFCTVSLMNEVASEDRTSVR